MKYLLLGGSHSELPLVIWAKERNIDLATLGMKKSLGVPGTQHFFLDYSNLRAVERIAKRINANRIIPGCNDYAAISASVVSENLKISHDYTSEQVILIHDKAAWTRRMTKMGVPTPYTSEITKDDILADRKIELPTSNFRYLLKPTDLTGGRGIVEVNSDAILAQAKQSLNLSRGEKLLLQQKIDGSLHSVLTLAFKGKSRSFFADEEIDSSYRVCYALMPSSLSKGMKRQVADAVICFMNELKIESGILHVQFMVMDDRFYIIDLCCRPPGDLYYLLLDYCYDIKLPEFVFEYSDSFIHKSEKEPNGCLVRYVAKPGESMKWVEQKNVVDIFEIRNTNGAISDEEFSGVIYFLRFATIDLAVKALNSRAKHK